MSRHLGTTHLRGWAETLLAGLLALVFATAAVGKLLYFVDFLRVVRAFDFLPNASVPALSAVLISVELALAVSLVVPGLRHAAAWATCGVLVFFLALAASAWLRGLAVECGCFTFLQSRDVGLGLFLQDLALLAAAGALVWQTRRRRSLSVAPSTS